MQFSVAQTLALLSLAVATQAAPSESLDSRVTRRKANEYKTTDCSGKINYSHVSGFLDDVSMDATTNSVYLTNGMGNSGWTGYTGGLDSKGTCTGTLLTTSGYLSQGCVALGSGSTRINCVHVNTGDSDGHIPDADGKILDDPEPEEPEVEKN